MSRAIGNVAGSKPSPCNVESPNRSGQAMSTYAKSFSEYVEELVSISKEAKECINENDTDGVVHFTHHDDVKSAKYVQDGIDELEIYSNSVGACVYREIDKPFLEKMDKFIEDIQRLNIDNYEVKNTVGYKKTTILNHGGKKYRVSTEPEKIKLKDLYEVESPYKAILKLEYDEYKKTDDYKKNKISKEEYLQYVTHTKAFKYESLNDKKYSLINKIILVGTIVVNVVCPPAGLVLDVTLASLEVSSSVTGKDWLTGEKLSAEERMLRVGLAAISFIPGIKGIKGIAKGETSLKSIVKFRKIEDFKHMASSVQQTGKNILNRLANYGNKKLISGLEMISKGLRKVDDAKGMIARRFTLNRRLQPVLADGVMPVSKGLGNKLADRIDNILLRDDILVEPYKILVKNKEISGQTHHLNQDAAFGKVISKSEGYAIKLDGNIFKDIDSPHYKAHQFMEKFWDKYRKKSKRYSVKPTIAEYNDALEESLIHAGLTKKQAKRVVRKAVEQQEKYGLKASDYVPRVPKKINIFKNKRGNFK